MSLPLSQIVNVQLNTQPVSSPRRDFSLLALFTSELAPFTGNIHYLEVATQADVETAFGTDSDTARATLPFWSQSPKPTRMLIAPWRTTGEQPQTVAAAMAGLTDRYPDWYAAVFVGTLSDQQIKDAAAWVLAADKKVLGLTTTIADHIENDTALSPFADLASRESYRTVALYDKDDPHAIMSCLARVLSVNFAANNSTMTMKFKQLPGVSADNITLTEANKCKALGLNFYTYFDQSAMLAEGTVIGGRFFDEIHILDWFVDAVQKEVFSTLYRSPTKIPLTDAGTARLIAAVRKVCREGVNNGAFAPGVWNGDPFGTLAAGDRLDDGFYVWADTVDNLSTSDREQRKAPPIQVALKLAGAIHSADIIVNFDR
ncbi:Phage-related protein [plant metagenome]|uniref:Phage-related protein n=1 Tax=plant metagenome TaxID=1297885 RepID=A0A484P2L0_9ZZZZ